METKQSNFVAVGEIDKAQLFKPVDTKGMLGKTIKAVGRSDEYGAFYIFFEDDTFVEITCDHSEERPIVSWSKREVSLKQLEKEAGYRE